MSSFFSLKVNKQVNLFQYLIIENDIENSRIEGYEIVFQVDEQDENSISCIQLVPFKKDTISLRVNKIFYFFSIFFFK